MEHDFINTGTEVMKLLTVYSPPEHPEGVVHVTKADALAHPEEQLQLRARWFIEAR